MRRQAINNTPVPNARLISTMLGSWIWEPSQA
jgi:hypothetical protein